jgi:hypothetical protein
MRTEDPAGEGSGHLGRPLDLHPAGVQGLFEGDAPEPHLEHRLHIRSHDEALVEAGVVEGYRDVLALEDQHILSFRAPENSNPTTTRRSGSTLWSIRPRIHHRTDAGSRFSGRGSPSTHRFPHSLRLATTFSASRPAGVRR